ncbi:MAG: hypothetical protein QG553_611 [Patescibacteria group bacterium]|nr:hypothetical protein [Patescibacteria group bacterium]
MSQTTGRIRTALIYIVGITVSLLCIFLVNRMAIGRVQGINLPFGWEGPHYVMAACEPGCSSIGVPFTFDSKDDADWGWYSNNAAVLLDIGTGVALGLGIGVLVNRKLK